jgi:dTDP-4-amino-4,6-dideoxygalactose transaminase
MRFVPLSPELAEQWDALVYQSPDGWLYGLSSWQQMFAGIADWGFEDHSFAVFQGEDLVAVLPLHKRSDGVLVSSAMGASGPVLRAGMHPGHREKLQRAIFSRVGEIALRLHSNKLEVALPPLSAASLGNLWGVNPLVGCLADVSTHTRVIDLQSSADELFARLAQDARRQVRLAQRAGYRVERGNWLELVDEYYRVHSETYHRTGVAPHPLGYFEAIATRIATQGHAVLWVGRDAAGKAVAFHNCARYAESSLYWTGCCETGHLDSGINYLLFWHAIEGARADGCRWYETGESFPEAGEGKLRGLSVFKSKFGGDLHRFFKGELVFPKSGGSQGPLRWVLDQARRRLPALVGARGAALIGGGVRVVQGGLARGGQTLSIIKRDPRRLAQPYIPFIKPYWSAEELGSGPDASAADPAAALAEFCTALRRVLGIGTQAQVVATSSGRTALMLVLRVLKQLHPGRNKVLLPSYGCKGTFDPIVASGLVPCYLDLGQDLLSDPESVKRSLGPDVLACLLVHLTGKRMPTREILASARELGVATIEDHCQSFGLPLAEDGLEADFYLYSFGIGKNLMATAGGALVANTCQGPIEAESRNLAPEPVQVARERWAFIRGSFFKKGVFGALLPRASKHPEAMRHQFDYLALNPLDARLIVHQLAKSESIIALRRKNAARITAALLNFPDLFTLQEPKQHVYTKLAVVLKDPETLRDFCRFMDDNGVELEPMYTPLHLRDFSRRFYQAPLPVTENLYRRVINIPVRPNLTESEVNLIVALIHGYGRTRTVNG